MVKRSTLAVSLVVVLVLLSGCSALVGDDGGGNGNGAGTETPADPAEFEYADGFGPDGITDGQQALESYQSAVEAQGSYTGEYDYQISARNETTVEVTNRVDFENERGFQRADVDSPQFTSTVETYYDSDTRYRRSITDGEASNVSVREQDFTREELTSADPIRPLLLNASAYETSVEQRNGTSVVVYEATSAEGIDTFQGIDSSAEIQSFSATFAVDSEGLIHSASYEITYLAESSGSGDGESGPQERTVELEFELSALGETSVERPDWADEG